MSREIMRCGFGIRYYNRAPPDERTALDTEAAAARTALARDGDVFHRQRRAVRARRASQRLRPGAGAPSSRDHAADLGGADGAGGGGAGFDDAGGGRLLRLG